MVGWLFTIDWERKKTEEGRLEEQQMAIERTLAIIKPDGVEKNVVGKVLARIEEEGFALRGIRMTWLSRREAEGFYAVHRERPFFASLVEFMTRGPVVLMVLEREDAIAKWREVMGATNPAQAAEGTLRKQYASGIEENTVHGSDAVETSKTEIAWFFPESQIY